VSKLYLSIALPEPMGLRINDAAKIVGVGRSSIYLMAAWGEIKIIKIAGRSITAHDASGRSECHPPRCHDRVESPCADTGCPGRTILFFDDQDRSMSPPRPNTPCLPLSPHVLLLKLQTAM
jgi:hypothetical protein